MDYWAGSSPGSRQCSCGLTGTCYDPYKGCNCDSLYHEWLQDVGNITQKEHLPVSALHFGDTGTPFDQKMGRFSLGPLVCSGDIAVDQEIHLLPGAFKIKIERGRTSSSELFLEFRTSLKQNVKIIEIVNDLNEISRLKLIGKNSLEFEWSSMGRNRSLVVSTIYSLTTGVWHSVMVETNYVEVVLVLDMVTMASATETNYQNIISGDLVFGGDKVRQLIDSYR